MCFRFALKNLSFNWQLSQQTPLSSLDSHHVRLVRFRTAAEKSSCRNKRPLKNRLTRIALESPRPPWRGGDKLADYDVKQYQFLLFRSFGLVKASRSRSAREIHFKICKASSSIHWLLLAFIHSVFSRRNAKSSLLPEARNLFGRLFSFGSPDTFVVKPRTKDSLQ